MGFHRRINLAGASDQVVNPARLDLEGGCPQGSPGPEQAAQSARIVFRVPREFQPVPGGIVNRRRFLVKLEGFSQVNVARPHRPRTKGKAVGKPVFISHFGIIDDNLGVFPVGKGLEYSGQPLGFAGSRIGGDKSPGIEGIMHIVAGSQKPKMTNPPIQMIAVEIMLLGQLAQPVGLEKSRARGLQGDGQLFQGGLHCFGHGFVQDRSGLEAHLPDFPGNFAIVLQRIEGHQPIAAALQKPRQGVIIPGRDGVELVIVTASTGHRQAQKGLAENIEHVVIAVGFVLANIHRGM